MEIIENLHLKIYKQVDQVGRKTVLAAAATETKRPTVQN